jgi:hypothetical protein
MHYTVTNLVEVISVKNIKLRGRRCDDENFAYVAAWEYKGKPSDAVLHKEQLVYENIKLVTRSYK